MSFSKLKEYLDSLEERYGIPGCDCTIRYKHEEVFRHHAGYADSARTKPVSSDDLYFVYSATKVITCTAVLQLIERGKLLLTDHLSQYLPEFADMRVLCDMPAANSPMPMAAETKPAENKIRIIDLLSMTAGLSYDIETAPIRQLQKESGKQASTREVMKAIAQSPLLFEPGTHWAYSLAHDVLAAVVEVVSGQKFSAYLADNVFVPLGMKDAYFRLTDDNRSRLATQYEVNPRTEKVTVIPPKNRFCMTDPFESGGAGLICSVDAYAAFVDAMCNDGVGASGNRILSRSSIDLMRRNHLQGAALEEFAKCGKTGYGYGLGVRTLINKKASRSPLGEFGWDGADGAYLLIDPEHHLGIFYAQHVWGCANAFAYVHPAIRDMAYDAIGL